jgi:hypothetical protein
LETRCPAVLTACPTLETRCPVQANICPGDPAGGVAATPASTTTTVVERVCPVLTVRCPEASNAGVIEAHASPTPQGAPTLGVLWPEGTSAPGETLLGPVGHWMESSRVVVAPGERRSAPVVNEFCLAGRSGMSAMTEPARECPCPRLV